MGPRLSEKPLRTACPMLVLLMVAWYQIVRARASPLGRSAKSSVVGGGGEGLGDYRITAWYIALASRASPSAVWRSNCSRASPNPSARALVDHGSDPCDHGLSLRLLALS